MPEGVQQGCSIPAQRRVAVRARMRQMRQVDADHSFIHSCHEVQQRTWAAVARQQMRRGGVQE